uniref:Uncharacterized protein n=1 Tax=Dunaliella tertiolecta TaxID=3047 RepID=A0A7S3QTL7_DUNTE
MLASKRCPPSCCAGRGSSRTHPQLPYCACLWPLRTGAAVLRQTRRRGCMMMMQAMSKGGPRPLIPPLVPPPGLGNLPPHLQAAAMEQHHMHAMMLARSGLTMPRPPIPPPHMQQQQQHPFRAPPHMPFSQQQHQQQHHHHQHPMQPPQRSLQPFGAQGGPRPPPAGWNGINNNRISRGRPVLGGELMSPQELGHIMQIMYAAVHSGIPYVEDYYYQAFVNKHANGANAPAFEPQALQDLSESVVRLDPSAGARFAALDGLGKFVLSNIRTPKVLMDLSPQAGGQEALGPGLAAKPLEQEPLLAARIMIEDCLHLMLDVDDIDRLFTAAAARAAARREGTSAAGAWDDGGVAATAASLPTDAASLRQRRGLLAAGLTSSLRLPASPDGSSQAAGPAAQGASSALQSSANGGGTGDGVLLRIMSLAKGRALVARALRTLLVPPVQYLAESGMRSSGQASRQLPPTAALGRFENGEFKLEPAEGARGMGAEADGVSAGAGIEDVGLMELEEEELQQGRPEPAHLLWGVLRTSPKLFNLPGGLSVGGGAGSGGGAHLAEEERAMLQATHRLAASLCHVLSQMTKPRQLADALTALSVGLQTSREVPYPLVHTAAAAEGAAASMNDPEGQQQQQQPWLGEVVRTLVARGQELGVDSHPTAGPTWRAGLLGLQASMLAHIQACLKRVESGGGTPHTLHAAAALACPSLMDTLACQLPSSSAEQLRSALQPLLSQTGQ